MEARRFEQVTTHNTYVEAQSLPAHHMNPLYHLSVYAFGLKHERRQSFLTLWGTGPLRL